MGGMAGNPDPWADGQSTLAPTPAGGVDATPVAAPEPPAVVPQPVLPGWSDLAPKPADGASTPAPTPSAPTSNATETYKPVQPSRSYPFQVGPEVPQIYPQHFQAEADARRRAMASHEFALARAMENGGEEAAALRSAKDKAPSVFDQTVSVQLEPVRAAAELGKGAVTGVGDGISGIGTFLSIAHKGAQNADLQRMKDIDARGKPRFDDSDRVKFYFRRPDQRDEERRKLESAAAVPLEERWLYKNGKAAGDWLKIEPGDPRYETLYNIGKEGGKLLLVAPVMYMSPSLGTVIMIGMETGGQTNDAIEQIKKKEREGGRLTEEETTALIEFNQRGVMRNAVTNFPVLKVAGTVGGNYVMRVIQQKAGPGWTRVIGAAGEAVEGAGSAGLAKYWENADARDGFDPGRELDSGVGDAALAGGIFGFAKAGLPAAIDASRIRTQQLNRVHSNRYVEPETLAAENANKLASRAASLAETIQGRRQAGDTRNFDELINEQLGSGAKGYISPLKLTEMIDAGYFFDKKIDSLGLREKITIARETGRDVELSMRDLVEGNNIRRTKIDEVMQNLKFEERGPTGREAGKILEERYKQLKGIEDRFGNAEPTKVEGGYAFSQIHEEVKRSGRMKRAEVSRQAARRIEVLDERARDMSTEGRRETADTVYLRDEYRKMPKLRRESSSKESQRLEDEYVATRLRELGIAQP